MSTEEERMSVEEFVHLLAFGRARDEVLRRCSLFPERVQDAIKNATSLEEVNVLPIHPDQRSFFVAFYKRTKESERPRIERELTLRKEKLGV